MRKHYYSYELRLKPARTADALRFGTRFHDGLENGEKPERPPYPLWAESEEDRADIDLQLATCDALLDAYWEFWADAPIDYVEKEQEFCLPLRNPATNYPSHRWTIAGKIDGIGYTPDGRLMVVEHKTTSSDLEPGSQYWMKLDIDQQVTLYLWAAREMGYPVEGIIYDVVRKPTIRPKGKVVDVDENGDPIILDIETGERAYKDAENTKPYKSASRKYGRVTKSHPETVDEYVARLKSDIQERPDFYFRRQILSRLRDQLETFACELWHTGQDMIFHQNTGCWPRNTSVCTRPYKCPYLPLCLEDADPVDWVPEGYIRGELHPELDMIVEEN
jgi:hypothetical protein